MKHHRISYLRWLLPLSDLYCPVERLQVFHRIWSPISTLQINWCVLGRPEINRASVSGCVEAFCKILSLQVTRLRALGDQTQTIEPSPDRLLFGFVLCRNVLPQFRLSENLVMIGTVILDLLTWSTTFSSKVGDRNTEEAWQSEWQRQQAAELGTWELSTCSGRDAQLYQPL